MNIKTNKGTFDLPSGFSMPIEETSPVYNDRGSQSLPVTVPATPSNNRLAGFPTRPDSEMVPEAGMEPCVVADGSYIRSGKLNIVSAGRRDGISFNVGFDNSTAYNDWSKKKLSDMEGLPSITIPEGDHSDIYDVILRIYTDGDNYRDDLAVFPLAVDDKTAEYTSHPFPTRPNIEKTGEHHFYEILNHPLPGNPDSYRGNRVVKRVVNSEVTDITVPPYYGLTAFVKLWKVVELVFADSGYTIDHNPLRDDPELARIVVLNNTADACCRNRLDFADLMPDVTVEDFLQSLWTRFGFVYSLDSDAMVARPRLLRDIIKAPCGADFSRLMTDWPLVTYESPRYVKLSASTSLEGAAPVTERFEDFIKDFDLDNIVFGRQVAKWVWSSRDDDFEYDWPEYNPDPDPDPDQGRDDWDYDDWEDRYWDDYDDWGRDDYSARGSKAVKASGAVSTGKDYERLAFEVVTSRWYMLDRLNHEVGSPTTSFFNWDPQPKGMEAMELQSVDEWVPLDQIDDYYSTGFSGTLPMYLAGPRYRHTYVSEGETDKDEEQGCQTPLAFLFAFNGFKEYGSIRDETVGRFCPESKDGKYIEFRDGSVATMSLLFQFKNGLFARFWREYDELLRHAAKYVEVPVAIDKASLRGLDILLPVRYDNGRYLIDKISYQLPSPRMVEAELTLRPLLPAGRYDLDREQGIPDFEPGLRRLRWSLEHNGIDQACMSSVSRQAAIDTWLNDSPPTEDKYRPYAKFLRASPVYPQWHQDPDNQDTPKEGDSKTKRYKAMAVYDIHKEVWKDGVELGTDGLWHAGWMMEPEPCARVEIQVEYQVRLIGKWVQS